MSEVGCQNGDPRKNDIHVFQKNGLYLGIHGSSMKVFELDAPSYSFLKFLEDGDAWEAAKTKLTVEYGETQSAAVADGYGLLLNELHADLPVRPDLAENPKFTVKNLMFLVAEECNLACSYCFVNQGNYGQGHKPPLMNRETAVQAIDFFVDGGYLDTYCILCFFGGEPLLNFDLVEKISEYAWEKLREKNKIRVGYSLTTNATLLTEQQIDYMLAKNFGIMISVDGPPEIHNRYRQTHGHEGTYDQVAANTRRLIEKLKATASKSYLVGRPTLTASEPDIHHLVQALEGLGFENIVSDPVSAPQGGESYTIGPDHVPAFAASFQKLTEAMLDSILTRKSCSYSPIAWILNVMHNRIAKFESCKAGVNFCTVDTLGDIYPCHRWVGFPERRIGNIWTGMDESRLRDTAPLAVDERQPCSACWARYFCGGGCYAESLQYMGSLHAVSDWRCAMFKSSLESYAWLYSMLQQKDPETLSYLADAQRPLNPAILE